MKIAVLKFLHLTTKQFVRVMSSLLFILVLMIGTVILLTEAIDDRQTEITEWVSQAIGRPVEIGKVDIHWFGFVPQLRIQNVRIRQQKMIADVLSFKEARLGIDLFATLKTQEPVLSELSVLGMELAVLRDDDGKFHVEGIPFDNAIEEPGVDWTYLATVLEQFSLEDIKLKYIDKINPEVSGMYEISQLSLIHEKSDWSWEGHIKLPQALGDDLSLKGHLSQEDSGLANSQWNWQVNIDDIKLAAFTREMDIFGVGLTRGQADIQLEGKAVGLDITSATANVDLSDFKLFSVADGDKKTSTVEVERFSGIFYWEKQLDNWSLSGESIQLQRNDDLWPISQFSVKNDSKGVIQAKVSYMQLADVLSLALLSNKWPEKLHQQLLKQQPAGDIEALNVEYSKISGFHTFSVSVQDFAVLPWQKFPGVTGLSGEFDLNDQQASLNIHSREVNLYADSWIDEALFFDSVSGVLRWQKNQQGWRLESETLHVWNDDLTLQLDGSVELQGEEIVNDVVLTLQDVRIKNWKRYVPSEVLLDDLEKWAIPAFVDGLITDGKITLQGPVSQFPYLNATDKGTFDIKLHTENAQLHYAPDWPDIVGVKGSITGDGNKLIIKSQFGSIAGFEFVDVTTTIDELATDKPIILHVDADIAGTNEHAIQFLQNSPLKQTFGVYTDSLTVSGKSDVHLGLMVPLGDPFATKTFGSVSLKDSSLQRRDISDIALTDINGKLEFTENGLSAKAIKAQLLGSPIQLDVQTLGGEDGQSTVTNIDVNGQFETKTTAKYFQQPLPEFISGKTSYEIQIKLAEAESKQFNVDFLLKTNLQGIQINLPEPIGKNSSSKVPLSLDLALLSDGSVDYYGYYGDSLNALLEQKDNHWRGEIRLGQGKAVLPDAGIRLRGGLPQLALDDWQDIQMKPSANEDSWTKAIDDVSLQFDLLTAYQQQLNDLSVSAQRAADVWVIQLNSNEVAGKVHWPLNSKVARPVEANLKHLHIKLPETSAKKADEPLVAQKTWPAVILQCDDFQIDKMNFGKFSLSSQKKNDQWIVESMEMVSPVLTLSATGEWRLENKGISKFNVIGRTPDLEAFLTSFGYQADIEAQRAEMEFKLSWPGSPADFSTASVVGAVAIDIGKGRLQQVDPGAAGRVFGFLSIAMLPSVLSFDFADLFGTGLGFDSIIGHFDVNEGQAYTNNFVMKGPRAEVEMKGRLGLVDRDYDQKIQITPNLGSTLPLAGAVAGGPVGFGIGTAIMLADKVTEKVLGQNLINVVKYEYHMTGSWDKPVVKRVGK